MMIIITFAVGYENQVSILSHPDRNFRNNEAVDALYKEIEAGCPSIRNYNLYNGIFQAKFSKGSDKLEDLRRLQREVRAVA